MDFSLSSSLVGSAVLNPDKLSLDLQFAADKTLTARKGPTPTFTRGSAATFVGSNGLIQSAAVNAARFDHNPVTLASKGLLIEEARTNLYSRSEEFNNIFWTKIRLSITADATTAPDGTLTADKLVEDTTASNTHTLGSSVTPPATAHTLSVFAKKGERTWIVLRLGGTNTFFNLDDGTIAAGSVNSPTITNFENGWYRCAVTSSAGTQGQFWLATNSTTTSYTGDGTSGIFIWGAQLEAGAFATSYIPTVASSVIRSADVCSIIGSAFTGFYNPVEGSFATSSIFNAPTSYAIGQVVFDVNDTTILNRTRPLRNATNGFMIYANTVNGTQDVAITGSTAINAGAVTKFAGCMKANDFTIYLNNVSQGVDTVSVMQSAPTTFTIGDASSGLGTRVPLNGTISSIRYFKKRLPNAKLSSLTV